MAETAKEYAAALFELAGESGAEKQYGDALKLILSEFEKNPEYAVLLSLPNIPNSERCGLIRQAFAGHVPDDVLNFAQLLCEKGRAREFSKCVGEYERLYRAFENVSTARIISAVPLTDEEKSALIKKLEKISGRTVTAQYETDGSLLGGVIVQMDGRIIDGSVKQKLNDIKEGL